MGGVSLKRWEAVDGCFLEAPRPVDVPLARFEPGITERFLDDYGGRASRRCHGGMCMTEPVRANWLLNASELRGLSNELVDSPSAVRGTSRGGEQGRTILGIKFRRPMEF